MLITVIINFFIGTFGSLALFLIATYIEGVQSFSAPFFVIAIGIICAVLSTLFGYWSTWVILGLFAVITMADLYRDREEIVLYWKKK